MFNRETFADTVPLRSRKFLDAASSRVKNVRPGHFKSHYTKAFFDIYREKPLRIRQALSFAYALNKESLIVNDGEYLAGQLYLPQAAVEDPRFKEIDPVRKGIAGIVDEMPELAALEGDIDTWLFNMNVGQGHIGWHWEWIVQDGTDALIERITEARERFCGERRDFLEGMHICIEAFNSWTDRHRKALRKISPADPRIEILSRVPRKGARSFREAVQSFHILYSVGMLENPFGGNGPGRLDYFLWPYLEKDIEAGQETEESAREIVDELFIRIHEGLLFQSDAFVQAIVVAGSHPDGSSAYNPLSRIMVESITTLKITHPSVYIRIPKNPPAELLDLAAGYLRSGNNRCQILNDSAIIEAMEKKGIPHSDAVMYMCGGCMEISSQGTNGDMLFTTFFNTPKILELIITGGKCLNSGRTILPDLKKDLTGYGSFDDFYSALITELQKILPMLFRRIDIFTRFLAEDRPSFFISSQIDDCIERGRGINDGGARYEDYGVTPLGIPNMGDSLFALKKAVFDDKLISAPELLDAMKNNFEGNEMLRKRLLAIPKFGQMNKNADSMTDRILRDICSIFDSYINRSGGKIRPMIMTFTLAVPAGRALGASPDGRRAHTPIAHGLTPQSSSMKNGISSAMGSANGLSLPDVWGGSTSMWDLDEKLATPEVLKSIIKTFIAQGGQIYQGNTTSVDELKKAFEEPAKYPELIVRVGGFSSRFTVLERPLQEEIINRWRHSA